MATAPRPRRADDTPRTYLRMRVGDRTLEMPSPAGLSFKERFAVRAATGLPIEAFFNKGEMSLGFDAVPVLWWLARRHNGEPHLAFTTVEAEFPGSDAFDGELEFVDVDPEEIDDPES